MATPIAFIVCTEPGRLEGQSLLLAESIRTFCGKLKDTPIYSFHPRVGQPISIQTEKAFELLKVTHKQIPINTIFHDYYLANKPLVCAYAEQNINANILVFIDSDQCFFSEPEELIIPNKFNVRIRPEYGKNIGSTGSQDPQDEYWQKLYKLFDVKREIYVKTPIGNKVIRGYWNSGLVAVRRNAGIFSAWKENFEKAMHMQVAPLQGNYFVEQSVLSATLASLDDDILDFSSAYSYPLPLHNSLSKKTQLKSLEQLVSIHYFNLFYYNDWKKQLGKLKNFEKQTEKFEWLCEGVLKYNMPFKSIFNRYILDIRKIENKLRQFNLDINLSHWMEQLENLN